MLGEDMLNVLPRAHGCKQQKAVLLILVKGKERGEDSQN